MVIWGSTGGVSRHLTLPCLEMGSADYRTSIPALEDGSLPLEFPARRGGEGERVHVLGKLLLDRPELARTNIRGRRFHL